MRFSGRTPDNFTPNAISKALETIPPSSLLDLTLSNPLQCGLEYPREAISRALGNPRSVSYDPHPLGHPQARQALAGYLGRGGRSISPENIILTASTSEAYSFLFKLLANPGEGFLVPEPSYPLLEHLLRLEGLDALPYRLRKEAQWPLDMESLQENLGGARGIIAVQPNNPTGSLLAAGEARKIESLCAEKGMAFLSDEVFMDYAPEGLAPSPGGECLGFRLGGLSKALGLPQLKLSWMVMEGPGKLLEDCRERLELIADTYLSVNTPVQLALGELLGLAPGIQGAIRERLGTNRMALEKSLEGLGQLAKAWPAQGGWYALVELLDGKVTDEEAVLGLLKEQRVFVQPGAFYDFPEGDFLVLSLLPPVEAFARGVEKLGLYLGQKP